MDQKGIETTPILRSLTISSSSPGLISIPPLPNSPGLMVVALLAVLGACGSSPSEPQLAATEGVSIEEIAIYQGIKRTLVKGGKQVTARLPLIAQRAALIRVFYKTDSTYDQKEVTARLTIKGQEPLDVKTTLTAGSTEDSLPSTINFYPPPAQIKDPLEYSIELLQERDAETDNPGARSPATGFSQLKVEGKKNTFRMIIVPFRYKADGSGRLPDTSKAQMQRFSERFLQLYPVSDVKITLHAPIDWTGAIANNGLGWQEVGMRLMQVRTDEKIPDETYLYGIFNPAATFTAYCGFGCMLGVTLLNNSPPTTGMVALRLALGVGYPPRATDTAAHEIGHSHGRPHANCGPGLAPSSIDTEYPTDDAHKNGKIGVWGFDIFARKLVPPTYTDIMGYCENKWISDHNFIKLWERGKHVNAASWQLPPEGYLGYDLIATDGLGKARWGRPIRRQQPLLSDLMIPVTLDGQRVVSGAYFRFDHIPGGWLFVPRSRATRARFQLHGRTLEVRR